MSAKSHIITMTVADQSRVVPYLQGELDAIQQDMLRDHIRKEAYIGPRVTASSR